MVASRAACSTDASATAASGFAATASSSSEACPADTDAAVSACAIESWSRLHTPAQT